MPELKDTKELKKALDVSFKKKVEYLIRASFGLVFVRTDEEHRTLGSMKEVCDVMKQSLYVWDCRGKISIFDDQTGSFMKDCEAIDQLFPMFASDSFRERSAMAVLDAQWFMDQPNVIRSLKTSISLLKRDGKIVIFVGPRLPIPAELEKDIFVVEFPLPDREELEKKLDYVVSSANDAVRDVKKKLEIEKETRTKLCEGALGLTSAEAEDLFSLAITRNPKVDSDAIRVVLDGKCAALKKDGILEYFSPQETMMDVGGLDNLKEWLIKRKKAFSQEAREFGLPYPKGILMVGISGCGKSLVAKAVSSNWEIPLIRLDVGRCFSKYQGESEGTIRKVISMAEVISPCVFWMDEIEKGLAGTKSSGELDSGTTARLVATLLTWMQEKTAPVFIVATANDVSKLPPELLRKGRFDEVFFVDLPNDVERKEIFNIQLRKRSRKLDDLSELIRESKDYTGAEIEQSVISALFDCFEDNKRAINSKDVMKALKSFVPLATTMQEDIQVLRQWGKDRARHASSGKRMSANDVGTAPFLRKVRRDDPEEEKEAQAPSA